MSSVSVKINANSSEFQSSMRAMTNSLREVDSEMNLASEQARLFGSNTDILATQVDMLSSRLEGQTAILAQQREYITVLSEDQLRLTEAQKAVEVSLADLNNERREALAEYGAESAEVKALDETILSLNAEYTALGKTLDRTNAKMATASIKANNMEANMVRTTASLNEANEAFKTRHIDAFSSSMGKVSSASGKVSSALKPLSVGLLAVGGYAGYASIKFEDSLAKLNTIADTGQVSMGKFKQGILELSNQTGVSASSIAESCYDAISAGVSTSDALSMVGKSTKLASAGFTTTGQSIDLLTTIMNSYGLKNKDIDNISNDLIRTQNLGKTTVDQLAGSMGTVIPTAKATGVSLAQLSSAYVEMTSKGISTAESGTMIKGMLSELSKTGSKSDEVLKKLTGTGFAGLMSKGKSVSDVLNILNEYAKKNGLSLKDMFGNVRAGTGALVLASDKGKTFNDILTKMNKTGNDTNVAYKKVSDTLGFKLHQSLTQAQNASIKLGDSLSPVISSLAKGLSNVSTTLSKLSPHQLKLISNTMLSVVAFTGLMGMVSKVAGGMSALGKGVSTTAGFFIKNTEGVSKFGKVLGGIKSVASTVGGAMKGLWLILMANPIVLIVAGITALVAGLVVAYNKVGWFRDMVNGAWKVITNVFNTFIGFLSGIFKPMWDTLVGTLSEPLNKAMGAISGLWDTIKGIFNGFIEWISGIFVARYNTKITGMQKPLQTLSTFISGAVHIIMGIFGLLISFVGSNLVTGFKAGFAIVGSVIKGALGVITSVINMIRGVLQGIVDFVTGVFTGNWSQAWNGIKEIFSSVWNGIAGICSSVWDTIKGIVSAGVNYITGIINNIFGMFDKVTHIASNIGHKVAGFFGFHIKLPSADITKNANVSVNHRAMPTSFASRPNSLTNMKHRAVSFASIGDLDSNLDSLNQLSNIASNVNLNNVANGTVNSIDIDSIVDKVANKIGEKVSKALSNIDSDKQIVVPVNIDGRQVAIATNPYLNRMNGKDIQMKNRARGY